MSEPHLIDADDAMRAIVYSLSGTSPVRVVLENGERKELEIAGVSYAAPPEDFTEISYEKGHIFVRCDSEYFIYQRLEGENGAPGGEGSPELRKVEYPAVFDQYTVLPPLGHETVSRIEEIEFPRVTERINRIEEETLLSRREAEVFVWRDRGADRRLVADLLGIAPSTVDEYSRRIKEKVRTAFRTMTHLDAEVWECPECGEESIDPRTVVTDASTVYVDCPNCGEVGSTDVTEATTTGLGDD